jgi:hypothetical protein
MSSTRSAKRTWTVSGQVAPGGRDATLTGYAYCSRKERTETSASEEILIRQLGSVESPACPKGTSLSGGFRAPPLSGQSFVVTFASYRAGDQWVTRAIQGGSAGSVTTPRVLRLTCPQRKRDQKRTYSRACPIPASSASRIPSGMSGIASRSAS